MKIIIPARLGSKGLPFKNRTLFKHTANIIPEEYKKSVWVTTDDPIVATLANDHGFNLIRRPDSLGRDTTSTREVLLHALTEIDSTPDDIIVMLYLTYPERTWEDIGRALTFFLDYYKLGITDSLLCKKETKTHPYLCLQELGSNGIFGTQLTLHDLYRRQDYPKCFEISHYLCIFKSSAIYKLNRNLYCDSTIFYEIPEVVDVDTQKDLDKFDGK
jgi:CMP-N-acetylneuraminic acid synthetase